MVTVFSCLQEGFKEYGQKTRIFTKAFKLATVVNIGQIQLTGIIRILGVYHADLLPKKSFSPGNDCTGSFRDLFTPRRSNIIDEWLCGESGPPVTLTNVCVESLKDPG